MNSSRDRCCRALVLAAMALLSACGNGTGAQTGVAGQDPTGLVISQDEELASRVAELLPALAERAGLELIRPVRVEWRSREELERYIQTQLDLELPPDRATAIVDAYGHLGLVDPDLDLRALLLELYLEQVAGFYDPDSLALWVMADQPSEDVQTVLLHELVHAVQDQAISLDAITHDSLSSDRRTAAQAALEGHATLVMLEEMFERLQGRPVDLSELPDVRQMIQPALEATRTQYPTLARAPRVLQEGLLFPYVDGAGFVLDLWNMQEGRPLPFGDLLPVSTEQVLHPDRLVRADRDNPSLVAATGPEPRYEDELGEVGVRVLLREHLGAGTETLATGWDGDRYWLYPGEEEGDSALRWVIVFDDASSRDGLANRLRTSIWVRHNGVVLTSTEVDGTAALVLEMGAPPAVTLSVQEEARPQ